MKYTVPNWYQSLIAEKVGLDPQNVSVGHEDDTRITFLQYNPRKEISVSKIDGAARETMAPFADKPKISVSRT